MAASSDPVMGTLTEITKTMKTMPPKKDLESFAIKADIDTLRSEVTKHVETKVKSEVAAVVSTRLSLMEARLAAAQQTAGFFRKTVASLQAGGVTHTTQNYSFDIRDPAHNDAETAASSATWRMRRETATVCQAGVADICITISLSFSASPTAVRVR